jgi:hypothetical protein
MAASIPLQNIYSWLTPTLRKRHPRERRRRAGNERKQHKRKTPIIYDTLLV